MRKPKRSPPPPPRSRPRRARLLGLGPWVGRCAPAYPVCVSSQRQSSEAWPPRASEAPPLVNAARDASSCELASRVPRYGTHETAHRISTCVSPVAARPGCSPTAFIAGGAALKPVASAQPVSVVQNVSDDLLDGAAVPHHLADDAGDWAGSLDDDEQRAAGAARSALALFARLVGVGGSGGSGMVCRVTGQLRWMHGAATAAVSCPAWRAACSLSLATAR
eukprot:5221053-Prymnesium_polylepis.2